MNKKSNVVITGTSSVLPKKVVSNETLEKMFKLPLGKIQESTGISQRMKWTNRKEAEKALLESVRLVIRRSKPIKIDLIIVGEANPTTEWKCEAGIIHKLLIELNCAAPRITYAENFFFCPGFVQGLNYANLMIQSGRSKTALVVVRSRLGEFVHKNPKYWDTSILWGDGVGAFILTSLDKHGVLNTATYCKPDELFSTDQDTDGAFGNMKGAGVTKFVTNCVPNVLKKLCQDHGGLEKINVFYLHQANPRILRILSKKLGVNSEKIPISSEFGNTSIASIPILYDQYKNLARPGNLIVFCGFGTGLRIEAMLYKKT